MHSNQHSGVDMFISDSLQLSLNPFKHSPGFKCLIITTKHIHVTKHNLVGRRTVQHDLHLLCLDYTLPRAGRKQMYLNLTPCGPFLLNIKSRVYACCYFRYSKTPGEAQMDVRPLCSARRDTIWFWRCEFCTNRCGCTEKVASCLTKLVSRLIFLSSLISFCSLQGKIISKTKKTFRRHK